MTTVHAITATQKTVDGPSGKVCLQIKIKYRIYETNGVK